MKLVGAVGKVGFSKAMSAGWICIDKGGDKLVKPKVETIVDQVKENLILISSGKIDSIDNKSRDEYKKRKLLQEVNSDVTDSEEKRKGIHIFDVKKLFKQA